jgi:hypothetical protein
MLRQHLRKLRIEERIKYAQRTCECFDISSVFRDRSFLKGFPGINPNQKNNHLLSKFKNDYYI